MTNNTIHFTAELVERLNGGLAAAHAAVAEAACAAAAQDPKVTVRAFADALRAAAPMLGTAQAVLAAAIKAAKAGKNVFAVAEAMADAAAEKARKARAARERAAAAAPVKALERAEAEAKAAEARVEACRLALRTPLEKATDRVAAAKIAFEAAQSAFVAARAELNAAEAELAELKLAEQRGQLIQVKAVETVWSSALAGMREHLLQVRSRLGPMLANESDTFKVEQMLEAEHNAALQMMSTAALPGAAPGAEVATQ